MSAIDDDAVDRRMRAKLAAHARWAQTGDRVSQTQPARDAFMRRFEDQVDPDRTLPTAERARRAESAMKAHMTSLAIKARRARKTA